MKAHKIVLSLCVAACLYFTWSCAAIKSAGVPIVVGTGAAILVGGGIPLLIGVVAASATWTAGVVVKELSPPEYPPYMPPPEPSWFDPWHLMRFAAGWAILILVLWLLAKRFPFAKHGMTALTLGVNKITAAVVDARRKRKVGPLKNVVVKEGEHP